MLLRYVSGKTNPIAASLMRPHRWGFFAGKAVFAACLFGRIFCSAAKRERKAEVKRIHPFAWCMLVTD